MPTASQMLSTLAGNLNGFHQLLVLVAALVGVTYVGLGVYKLATHHSRMRMGEHPLGGFYNLMSGGALASLAASLNDSSGSIFGSSGGVRTALDYASPSGSETSMLLTVIVGYITLWGWYGCLRAWVIWSSLSDPGNVRQGAFWNGVVFLVCGTLCANFMTFTDHIAGSFGTTNFLRTYVPN